MIVAIAFAVALFFAMNIGASGAAASMGIAYGSGAIKGKKLALFISAIGIFFGAAIGSGEVIETIGSGLIPTSLLTMELVVIILSSACASLFIANVFGIPLSTSEVTVGAIVGVGIAYHIVFFENLFRIVIWWVIIPIIAFAFSFIAGKWIEKWRKQLSLLLDKNNQIFILFVIATGFLESFSAGMNNAANAVGPLVGAGALSANNGMLLGGAFVALGAMLLGRRTIETNGKKITALSLIQGVSVSITSTILVIAASLYGIPIPMTQITTSGILGIGAAKQGAKIFQRNIIKKIVAIWVVSPLLSLAIAYTFVNLIIEHDLYTSLAIASVLFATIGTLILLRIARNERNYEQRRI